MLGRYVPGEFGRTYRSAYVIICDVGIKAHVATLLVYVVMQKNCGFPMKKCMTDWVSSIKTPSEGRLQASHPVV